MRNDAENRFHVADSFVKTLFDLVAGTVIAFIVTPVILVLAVGSLIAFRANPFFVQTRIGRHGNSFRFIKIRSLPIETPSNLTKDRLREIENGRWGRFIRHHHLDELPQVWLVVARRMSLVGPRPEMPSLEARLDPEHRAVRHLVLPGCTGLWQISVASAGMIKDSPQYDDFYVNNWSLRMDIWILLKTFKELAGGRAILSLDSIPRWALRSARATAAAEQSQR